MNPHPATDSIDVRRAMLLDVPFIRKLALESIVYSIPAGRDISNETVVQQAAESLKNLELMVHRRKEYGILVAVDRITEERAGYIIVEFNRREESTGELQSYIFDTAVVQEYMGKYVIHRMIREAAKLTHERGYRYMSALVTASNERSLLTAIKMGFDVERYALVMACDAGGIARMPGRPPQERSLIVNRVQRQRRRRRKSTAEEQE